MSRKLVHRFLIAYDIPDDQRRLDVADAILSFGDRIQFSVYIVDTSRLRLARLRRQLAEIIDEDEDSLMFCDLGPLSKVSAHFEHIGQSKPLTNQSSFIV